MAGNSKIERVLMTTDTVGGVWTYALDLASEYGKRGVQVALATIGPTMSDAQREQAATLSNVTVYQGEYKLEWMAEPWTDVERSGEWLLGLESEINPDIVHLNGYAHGALPWHHPTVVVGHSCVLSWWRAVKNQPAGSEWGKYHYAVSNGLRGAGFVVAPTCAMLAELHRIYGPLRATAVIANGRCSQQYHPVRKEPIILAAGRLWDEAKNIAGIAKIVHSIEWPVVVAGDAANPHGNQAEFEHIRTLGVLPAAELAKWYGRAAIYCLPARYEPFGLSVLEAALSGCALVLGDIPSLRENWEGAAVFVEPDDSEALAWRLRELIGNRKYLDRLAAQAIHRARSFTSECTADAYLALYAQLLRNPAPLAMAGD